jgi:hypothetical protein
MKDECLFDNGTLVDEDILADILASKLLKGLAISLASGEADHRLLTTGWESRWRTYCDIFVRILLSTKFLFVK